MSLGGSVHHCIVVWPLIRNPVKIILKTINWIGGQAEVYINQKGYSDLQTDIV